ncbi:lipopolysaccharide biosynthesis protein [Stappia sp.]|uniref:lipopolysaccharide biosynthesis protein n=1 Tax=Stappia sp. TaxID=1870903 RepID=UPI003A99C7FF
MRAAVQRLPMLTRILAGGLALTERMAAWVLPEAASRRVLPMLDRLRGIVSGELDTARAQRMALVVFATRVLGAALAYVMQVVLARLMGGHEYGIYAVVWTLVVILGIFTPLGFSSSVLRLIPEYRARGEQGRLAALLIGSRAAGGLAATAVALAGIAVVVLAGERISSHYVLPLVLGAVCLPMFTIGSIQDGIARAHDWTLTAMLPTFIWRPLAILAGMAAAVAAGVPATASSAVIVTIVATWTVTLLQGLALARMLAPQRLARPPREAWTIGEWLRLSVPILLVEGFFQLITSADVVMVSFWCPPDQVAIYFAASKTPALAHFVYFAVRSATAHRYSRLYHAGEHAELARLVDESARWTFWPTLLLAGLLAAVGPLLLALFGDGFTSGYPVILVLLAGVLARAAVGPVDALLTMADQQKACAGVYAAAFAVNIGLNIVLIPLLGILGAAVATAGAMVFEAAALAWQARRRLGIDPLVWRSNTGRAQG